MITLKEWMEVVDYRITEGSDYNGYGGAYALSSWSGSNDGHSLEIIFDQKTQVVYEVQACDYRHNRAYRLINELYKEERKDNEAWDDTKWTDLEEDDDWIQKALSIVAGKDYDTRVSVPIDLPDDELLKICMAAHKLDLTLNAYIEQVLKEVIERHSLEK